MFQADYVIFRTTFSLKHFSSKIFSYELLSEKLVGGIHNCFDWI